jgi:hypothetical protein
MAGCVADISWKEWCCQTGLNCRPLHYQWSALPLSYGSMPGIEGNRPKWPPTRRPVLATRAPLAQARGQVGKGSKSSKIGADDREARQLGNFGPYSGSRSRPKPPNRDLRCFGRRFGRRPMCRAHECSMDDRNVPFFRRRRPLTSLRSRHVRRTDDEGQSRQACGKERRGCEGFATGPAEAGVARKSQAAKVAGPRAQRCRCIFRKRRRLPR